jgi:hypothetical protein
MNQIIIIGGGASIPPGNELFNFLSNKWTIGCNEVYKFFEPTVTTWMDKELINNKHMKALPLVIGKKWLHNKSTKNQILLKTSVEFDRTLKNGIYCPSLVGVFSLSLAIFLLKNEGEIFLLGYDFKGTNGKDYFFQKEFKEKCYYDDPLPPTLDSTLFDPFKTVEDIKIYNVSPESRLDQFEKINYSQFYEKVNMCYNHEERRDFMKDCLKVYIQ